MTDFELTPGVIHRGLGFVARWPGLVVVVPSDPVHDQAAEELLGSLGAEPIVADVVRIIQNALQTGQLRTAGYLVMAPGGPMALVSGPIEVLSDGELALSGANGPVEQQVPATEKITVRAANLTKAAEPVMPFDLRRGIAPGAGITLGNFDSSTKAGPYEPPHPEQVGRAQPAAPAPPAGPPPQVAPSGPEPEVAVPFRSQLLFDQNQVVEPRPPLPIAARQAVADEPTAPYEEGYSVGPEQQAPAEPALEPGQASVHGILCSRGHFNNPSASYCMVCGISMLHVTHNLVPGIRPTLGYVVFDDGSTFGLDRSYLVGREPGDTGDPGVAPLGILDNNETLSRRHAEIRLIEWTVHIVDMGSTNGTFIWDEHNAQWNQVVQGQPVPLSPGDTVALGRRTFVFESVTGA